MKRISLQTFSEIKHSGHGVPRNTQGYIEESFKVCKEYIIGSYGTKETLKVRCTQDCPHHLILLP